MSSQKKSPAFQTFMLFGKQAQKLLESAKGRLKGKQERSQAEGEIVALANDQRSEPISVSLSLSSVVKATFAVLGIVLFGFLCYLIRDKILLLLLATFLAVVIDPGVSMFERWGAPRGFAILLVYVIVLTLCFFLIISLIPILAEQIQQMASRLGVWVNTFIREETLAIPFLSAEINTYLDTFLREMLQEIREKNLLLHLEQFGRQLSTAAQGSLVFVATIAGSVVQFVIRLVMVLVLAFFLQLEKEAAFRWVRVFLPYRYRRYAEGKAEAIHHKLAQWIRGQLMLSLAIALLVFTALTILHMPYALTLAVLAGFTEFVPVLGPIVAAIPALFIALAQSGLFSVLIVALVYYGVQWCENNLLVPLIMKRAVGLSPVAVMFAMLVGISFPDTIHPVLGILLAVPVATIIHLFLQDFRRRRE